MTTAKARDCTAELYRLIIVPGRNAHMLEQTDHIARLCAFVSICSVDDAMRLLHATGGTFALYAQLRRQGTKAARTGANDELERPPRPDWRQRFIESRKTQNVLRVLVVLGVGAIMGDGVLTPVSRRLQSSSSTIGQPACALHHIIALAD